MDRLKIKNIMDDLNKGMKLDGPVVAVILDAILSEPKQEYEFEVKESPT